MEMADGEVVRRRGKDLPGHLFSRDSRWRREHAARYAQSVPRHKPAGELTACPVCGGKTLRHMVTVYTAPHLECLDCRHLFCSLVFDEKVFAEIYSDYVIYEPERAVFEKRVADVAAAKVDFVCDVVGKPSGLWIDVGCGMGDIPYAAMNRGWTVAGIEANKTAAEFGRKLGIPIREDFVTAENGKALLSGARVVSLFAVLEHLRDPDSLLGAAHEAVESGSYIVIEVPRNPSMSLFAAMCFPDSVARQFVAPYHLRYYSEKSLELSLSRHGFSVSGIWTFGQDYLELLSMLAQPGNVSLSVWPEIRNSIDPMQRLLGEFGLDDSMLVVARKN